MSAMREWETATVIRVECDYCDADYFIPKDRRGQLNGCPYCGDEDKQWIQGRTFEVGA